MAHMTELSSRIPTRRLVQSILALAMLTGLLTGLTASAAEIDPGQRDVNERILSDFCIGLGGAPDTAGVDAFFCTLPGGDVIFCSSTTLQCQAFISTPAPSKGVPSRGSRSRIGPIESTLKVFPATHLAWSDGRLITSADAQR